MFRQWYNENMNPQDQQPVNPAPVQYPAAPPQAPVNPLNPADSGVNFDPRLRVQMSNEPGVVHIARPIEPDPYEVSEELQQKHTASKQLYPTLNLSRGEYVIVKLHRHPIGLLLPVMATAIGLSVLVSLWILYPVLLDTNSMMSLPSMAAVSLVLLPLALLVGLFGYIAVWVYLRNTFFMTNESVIQEIQHSLFARHEQTVSLGSVEDVSYIQRGVLQTMLNYGMIRLSTEGEETTYRFYFVSNPKQQVAVLNNAVEDFKNGRPVTGHM